ncbi:MAG: proteasome subunit beta, partial [Candidatus Microthrix parvicella]|nr:proteasome subunit beta [Candidatus Microthrix parvicella]
GPDLLRGIYPLVATITERGFERGDEAELAERTQVRVERLRAQRGSPAAHDNH